MRWSFVLLAACGSMAAPPPPTFKVAVAVESDKNIPLEGAAITRNGRELGKTNPDGKIELAFQGAEGDMLDVWVKCPEGFTQPIKPVTVRLQKLSDNKVPEYPISCPPIERKVVVAVRADNGPNLPVRYLGREVARTDQSGAATFMMAGKPGDPLDFVLDTSEKGNERLKPQNPHLAVVVPERDAVVPLDQAFQLEKPKVVYVARPNIPRPIGPTQLR